MFAVHLQLGQLAAALRQLSMQTALQTLLPLRHLPATKDPSLYVQAVFDSCRTLDLRNATVSLGCVDLLRGAASLECLRLRSDYFTADKDGSKHEELTKFAALLPVSLLTRRSWDQF